MISQVTYWYGPRLYQNRLTGISSAPKFLTELRIGSNSFDREFPSEVMQIDRLNKLYLFHCPKIIVNIPSYISKITGMMVLGLSFTSLHGNIPSEFSLFKDLCYLDMDETHIYGPIPANLDNMQQIKYLSVELSQPTRQFL